MSYSKAELFSKTKKQSILLFLSLISLTNVSDEAQAAPQAFPTHVDMAQALLGKNLGQMRVSGKARDSCELPSKMHWKGEERVFVSTQ